MKEKNDKIVFRRIHGRIVPIRTANDSKKGHEPKKPDFSNVPKSFEPKKRSVKNNTKERFKLSNKMIGLGTTIGAYGETAEWIQSRRIRAASSGAKKAVALKDFLIQKEFQAARMRNFRWLRTSKKVTKIGLAITIGGLILKGFDR